MPTEVSSILIPTPAAENPESGQNCIPAECSEHTGFSKGPTEGREARVEIYQIIKIFSVEPSDVEGRAHLSIMWNNEAEFSTCYAKENLSELTERIHRVLRSVDFRDGQIFKTESVLQIGSVVAVV